MSLVLTTAVSGESMSTSKSEKKSYNPLELAEKLVLRLYSKLLSIAMIEFNYDIHNDNDEDQRNDEGDNELAQFVHILMKGYAIKSRRLLQLNDSASVNNTLCIENILINANLVQMNFLYFLEYNHKYNLDIVYIIKEAIIKYSDKYDVVTMIASSFKNDCVAVGDNTMVTYIINSFDYDGISDICRRVISEQDNFEQMGQFLDNFVTHIITLESDSNMDSDGTKDTDFLTNKLIKFLVSIFSDDSLTEVHGKLIL
jgi:hypothetical protein